MKKNLLLILSCLTLVACNNTENKDEPTIDFEETKGEEVEKIDISFSDENLNKIIVEPTFEIDAHTNDGTNNIIPHQLFSSGMCLQRDSINRIWGKVNNSNNIAIEFNGNVYYGTVESNQFEIYLPKMNAGGPYEMTIISEAGRILLTDVYIGEVFLLGGQSNMEWIVQNSGNVLKDLYIDPNCVNEQIRMLQVKYNPQNSLQYDLDKTSSWKYATQVNITRFSAVGYIFGKYMQEELGCPIGLISCAVGGSSIEFWLSEENCDKLEETYLPFISKDDVHMMQCLGYNGMFNPLKGYNMRGLVWYQGESNTTGTERYYDVALQILMDQCREMFNNQNMLFAMCELARFNGNPYAYSIINERINYIASIDQHVVVARNLDLGEWNDIHPKDKREIAKRAAYEVLRVFFDVDKPAPVELKNYKFNQDGSVTIELSKEVGLLNGTNGFEVFVNGNYTYDCDITVNGNKLTIVANGEITKVRYGYRCEMTPDIVEDVSQMVTVYDENCMPLDLFIISK